MVGFVAGVTAYSFPPRKRAPAHKFASDALMHEVAAVASRVRSRFRSWIKHSVSSISQDSDFMHQQHGFFFFFYFFLLLSRVVDGRFCGRKSCQWSYICEVVLPSTVQSLFSLLSRTMGWKVKLKKKRKHCIRRAKRVTRFDTIFWLSGFDHQQQRFLFFSHQYLPWKGFHHFLLLLFVFCQLCHVGLSPQHGCDRISPVAFHLLRIQQYTIGTSFFFSCVAFFFIHGMHCQKDNQLIYKFL